MEVFNVSKGPGECRKCNLEKLHKDAYELKQWEGWLRDKYYGSQNGLGNPFETIGGYINNPVCKANTQQPIPQTSNDSRNDPWDDAYGSLPVNPVATGNDTKPTSSHPCQILKENPEAYSAEWHWSSKFGAGGHNMEAGGRYICLRNGFVDFSGNSFKTYICDETYTVNCRPGKYVDGDVTKTERNKDGTLTYHYGGGPWFNRGRRIPK